MKCLTVKQPWASLLVTGATQYLVRNWRTSHRGPLAIQASSKFPKSHVELCCDPDFRPLLRLAGFDYAIEMPRQAVLGTVSIADCLQVTRENRNFFDLEDPAMHFGLIQPGCWAWICSAHCAFVRPVPLPGRLGIYTIPSNILPS